MADVRCEKCGGIAGEEELTADFGEPLDGDMDEAICPYCGSMSLVWESSIEWKDDS